MKSASKGEQGEQAIWPHPQIMGVNRHKAYNVTSDMTDEETAIARRFFGAEERRWPDTAIRKRMQNSGG